MSNPFPEAEIPNDKVSSELLKKAESLNPEFNDNAEALAFLQRKLEMLAASMELSVETFLKEAEASPRHSELFLQGIALQRQIKFFKSQAK